MNDGAFTLDSSPAPIRGKRRVCDTNPAQRQTVLFAGLACLPGQEDLFPTDGRQNDVHHNAPLCTTAEVGRA
jgi:hypothetical protein